MFRVYFMFKPVGLKFMDTYGYRIDTTLKLYWKYFAVVALAPWFFWLRGGNSSGTNAVKRGIERDMARLEAKLMPRQIKKQEFDAKYKPKTL